MNNGIVGTMTASWSYYGEEDNSTVLYGTEGIMKIYSNPKFAIEIITKDVEKYYMILIRFRLMIIRQNLELLMHL